MRPFIKFDGDQEAQQHGRGGRFGLTRRDSLWHRPDFLKLWAGQTVSQFGAQIGLVVFPLIAVLVLHANAWQMGILMALATLPFILIGLFAGVYVDRLRRRPLLILADVGRALLMAAVPVLDLLGWLSMADLYLIQFLTGCLTVLFDVAYQSYLPSLIDREALNDGNGKMELTNAMSAVAGPSLGGILVRLLSAPVTLWINGLTYMVSVVSLVAIRTGESTAPRAVPGGMRSQIREGMTTVLKNPLLAPIAGSTATANLFSSVTSTLFVLFAVHQLHVAAASIGLIYGLGSLGGVAGALLQPNLVRRLGLGSTIFGGTIVTGLSTLSIAIIPASPMAVPLLTLARMGIALGALVYNVSQVSLRQAITPGHLLGRMTASMRFIVWGTLPVGSLFGGLLGTQLGYRGALWVAGLGSLLACAWIFFSPVLALQGIPTGVENAW